jgi:Amt family ammonium transporter
MGVRDGGCMSRGDTAAETYPLHACNITPHGRNQPGDNPEMDSGNTAFVLVCAASAAISGLVGITPACGYVDTFGAIVIGLACGVVCQLAIRLKYRLGYDDSLDVVAIHGVGGAVGLLLTGLFATTAVNSAGANGLFYGGGGGQLGRQAIGVLVAAGYAFVVTFGLAWLVRATMGFRVAPEVEAEGIDEAEHAESAYEFSPLTTTGRDTVLPSRPVTHEGSAT